MTNKDKIIEQMIFNIKNAPDSELPYMYSQCANCKSCVFGKEGECLLGPEDCDEFIANKLKEKMEEQEVKEDEEEALNEEKEDFQPKAVPNEWALPFLDTKQPFFDSPEEVKLIKE